MARLTRFYGMWLLIGIGAALVGWIVLANRPVRANMFEAYNAYMPGEDARNLLMNDACDSESYEASIDLEPYLVCQLNDGMVSSAVVSMTGDNRIQGVYFFMKDCAVNAGDLALWYDADIKAVRHGSRLITWSGGQTTSWSPGKAYWSPKACLLGVWFENGSRLSNHW
jgi:hypothetical protein